MNQLYRHPQPKRRAGVHDISPWLRRPAICIAGLLILCACGGPPADVSEPTRSGGEILPRPVLPRQEPSGRGAQPWPTALASPTLAGETPAPATDGGEVTSITAAPTPTSRIAATLTAPSTTPATVTGTVTATGTATAPPAEDFGLLPTVTPTPAPQEPADDAGLLPAPTASARLTATTAPTLTATLTGTAAVTGPATSADGPVLLPTVTPTPVTPEAANSPGPPPGATAAPESAIPVLPTVTPTPESGAAAQPLYASGHYTSQTTFDNGQVTRQAGFFTIEQIPADNAYGVNQRYTLTAFNRAAADPLPGDTAAGETITVHQIGGYIAINYPDRAWVVVRRDQGSSLVKSIQPITELARIMPGFIDRGRRLETTQDIVQDSVQDSAPEGTQEDRADATVHYRLTDPGLIADDYLRPLLATNGRIRDLSLDAWLDESSRTIERYTFQVAIEDARVLNADFESTTGDQVVTWTYTRHGSALGADAPAELAWPAGAPDPTRVDVPGFAAGEFPLPPDAELRAIYSGAPEFVTGQPVDDVATFYQARLAELGWSVEGSGGLLRAQNGAAVLQLLVTGEEDSEETRISILQAE